MTTIAVERVTCTRIPTQWGEFQLCYYSNNRDDEEHLALVVGDPALADNVLVRVHSECFTGDVLGSLRCDCGPQLRRAMELIAAEGEGVLIYLRQEGRGIGLLDKLRAYNLQDEGYDTVDANLMLGHQADAREYTVAALILQDLGVEHVRLLTNNPTKIESLRRLGIDVSSRVPLEIGANVENVGYLQTKVERMRHLLDLQLLRKITAAKDETSDGSAVAKRRPHVTLSYAQSLDGSITDERGQTLAISGPESLMLTHRLRANHDAVLVGIGTVLADDPQLTVRLVKGADPQPVIVDSLLRFPLDARLLQSDKKPWIAATSGADAERKHALEAAGARVLELPVDQDGRVRLDALLQRLAGLGIDSLMVEGGAEIIGSFLQEELVDRVVVTVAPMLVAGLPALEPLYQEKRLQLPRLRQARYEQLGDDIVLFADVEWQPVDS